jgi:ribosomal protein S18 acetylase RimI-like enzyme
MVPPQTTPNHLKQKKRLMIISSLEKTPLSEITRCFNEAFSDYFIPFNATQDYLRTRWKVARVKYDLSFGAFDGNRLVGFIIHGIGKRDGKMTAHNAATGIEPAHRGKGLLGKIYAKAIDALQENGIEQSTLEVISKNERAIKAYEKVGFKLRPELLHCFQGTLRQCNFLIPENIEIKKVEKPNWPVYKKIHTSPLTWEMTPEALSVFPSEFEYREIWKNEEFTGHLIHSPKTGLIQQYAIRPDLRRQGLGTFLFYDLRKNSPHVRVNNVPESDVATISFLKNMGFENHIDQYEMKVDLSL